VKIIAGGRIVGIKFETAQATVGANLSHGFRVHIRRRFTRGRDDFYILDTCAYREERARLLDYFIERLIFIDEGQWQSQ
jgi:hypothetical protein